MGPGADPLHPQTQSPTTRRGGRTIGGMSTQALIESQREGAEVSYGADICKEQSMSLLEGIHLPKGLLPLAAIEEVGYNRATGFVWLKQKKSTTHVFKAIGKTVSYAQEVTAFVEDRRMKRMTGVKSREFLIWISVSDMYIDDPESKRITFKTPAGIGRSFPVSAFQAEEEEEEKPEAKEGDGK
ncbi:unnamed protein product [Musa acuminata subsp. malaccensis]|uniref:(wild Malaysian banana) hypothetical protein n=1 Tax=Musa acuminata subsp. malaccensis TaxID=214687 RepID=A0A804JVJ8_MUSAM|nr:PREDICTED: uncharacterized protein LOC103991625 [Musa acuminata subsp. malaccensis]CAG1856532.1 unnamed protein product [Musa acuminata subsp. malaccensis]